MSTYQLSIITPNGQIFQSQIDSLTAPGTLGSFGVLPRHTPMVTSLKSGPLSVKQEGNESYFAISSGVLEVDEQRDVLLLANFAVSAGSLVEAKSLASDF